MRQALRAAAALGVLLLAACAKVLGIEALHLDDPAPRDRDASSRDAGVEARTPTPCLGLCEGATPICDAASGECRICVADQGCEGDTPVCDESGNSGLGECVACLTGADCPSANACDLASRWCRPAQPCDRCRSDRDCGGSLVCFDLETFGEPGLCARQDTSCQADQHCCTVDLESTFASSVCNPNFTCTPPAGDAARSSSNCQGLLVEERPDPVLECEQGVAPSGPEISDFCHPNAAAIWGDVNGFWGWQESLGPSLAIDTQRQQLHITGPVDGSLLSGVTVRFGRCTDASAYRGLEFTIGGEVGPTDRVGLALAYGPCDETCETPSVGVAVPEVPGFVQRSWEELGVEADGSGPDVTRLIGVFLTFDATEAFQADLVIDDLAFW
jgi:hypothetical protein